jgi:predicted secreted hydrolase
MLFQLRTKSGDIDPHSSGTVVDARGAARHLTAREFSLEPERYWVSPKTKARYPVRWRIQIPAMALDLHCESMLDAQELTAADSAGPNYWEGAVRYSGSGGGIGYLEMTGYDKPVRLD